MNTIGNIGVIILTIWGAIMMFGIEIKEMMKK